MGGKVYGTRGKGRKMSKKKGRGGEGKFRGGRPPKCFFLQPRLVHKCLNGRAPGYMADDFRLAGRGRPGSRSAASMMLDIPRTTTSLEEHLPSPDRVSGTAFLLPSVIRHSLSLSIFGKRLKT